MRRLQIFFLAVTCSATFGVIPGALAESSLSPAPVPRPQPQKPNHITVQNGFLTLSSHSAQRALGYFTIRNDDDQDHLLQGISSPACTTILARHSNQEYTVATENLFSHLAIPKNSEMIFPPSSYHLLCEGMTETPAVGSTIPFTFTFLGGKTVTVQFDVRAPERK